MIETPGRVAGEGQQVDIVASGCGRTGTLSHSLVVLQIANVSQARSVMFVGAKVSHSVVYVTL